MRTEFDNASAVQHGDPVRVTHSRDAVRDEDRCASLHHIPEMIKDLVFGMCIHAGERVIKDQDSGIADQRASDRRGTRSDRGAGRDGVARGLRRAHQRARAVHRKAIGA